MLAAPLMAQPITFAFPHNLDDARQLRPAPDMEAFNKLLPPAVEFIEGSSSGALAVPEGRYVPINATPPKQVPQVTPAPKDTAVTSSSSAPPSSASTPSKPPKLTPKSPAKQLQLHSGDFDMSWPDRFDVASGLYNTGNTCFLNSVLQCLIHTPPLLRMLQSHNQCKIHPFCMTCGLRTVAIQSHQGTKPINPTPITNKLHVIAKHLRKGRQEDSHEFLRYAIEGLQKSCLADHPPKLDPKIAETSWVYRLFGGQLRSRVTCQSCGHNSDTFDRMLDMSTDIHHAGSVKDALRKFVAPDILKGADKYKCEKCKKHVNAEKRFTIHEAPRVLTLHLKRFSPLGRKIGNQVNYDDQLSLQPYMSQGQFGPGYSLCGVICHAGGGPNSGHYYAFVKSRRGRWHEMNDESTSASRPPFGLKNAYILFYLQNKGQKLESALNTVTPSPKSGMMNGQKRKAGALEEEEEDAGVSISPSKPFIGPVLPSPPTSPSKRLKVSDPKRPVQQQKASSALTSLNGYNDSDGENAGDAADFEDPIQSFSSPHPAPSTPSNGVPPSNKPTYKTIPASSFYGNNAKKPRKSQSANPFGRMGLQTTYGKNRKSRPL